MNGKERDAMMKKVQELSFAKCETELFLDTHPDCRQALDYYHRILSELDAASLEYRAKYGPITAADSSTERWDWVDAPWPWHNGMSEQERKGAK